VPVIVTE
jgi:hypothetical protein